MKIIKHNAQNILNLTRHKKVRSYFYISLLAIMTFSLLFIATTIIWVSTMSIPDFSKFAERKVANSTKLYDRTGKVLLYDVYKDVRRTNINYADISSNIINATIAVEDENFYNHSGVRVKSIFRAFIKNLKNGQISQGGSTITQQIIKNTLLTNEKTITRKIKELILAIKLEKNASKEEIITLYLNEAPYGGSIYGIEEASRTFLNKNAKDLTLAESAYLAALPNAPTTFSPYGKHVDLLEERKNFILNKMKTLSFITQEQYDEAMQEKITFQPEDKTGIRAPHFVMYVKQYLEEKYGADALLNKGLSVTTTLDYDMQQKMEDITKQKVLETQANFGGTNTASVALDPKTGQVLSLVGSRDYFDKEIDGQFDVATLGLRQPGSSFKPFVYTLAFEKGYKPETVLFDIPTEFSSTCDPYGNPYPGYARKSCYMPDDFDGLYKGPMTLRAALGESRNIPAVELLYLVGVDNAINFARDLGITTLSNYGDYGLTLVLGGGEVKLIDMVSAYGVFANNGFKNDTQTILEIKDKDGNILESYKDNPVQKIDADAVIKINDVLSDHEAKVPTFGYSLAIPGRDVAVKTGTTNDYKDVWAVGYTPNLVVGTWVGNNDGKVMKKVKQIPSAQPIWRPMMTSLLEKYPVERFKKDVFTYNESVPPVINGLWYGGEKFTIDKISGLLATEFTPDETKENYVVPDIHNILYWVNKSDLNNSSSGNTGDSLYNNWEVATKNYISKNMSKFNSLFKEKPVGFDNVHTILNKPTLTVTGLEGSFEKQSLVTLALNMSSLYPIKKLEVYINDEIVDSFEGSISSYQFVPIQKTNNLSSINDFKIVLYDTIYNKTVFESKLNITNL